VALFKDDMLHMGLHVECMHRVGQQAPMWSAPHVTST
jgi:hypothetical protein